tara:strand:- start:70 stop:303 length:234 start_codon:yes stop_codon:yes gene_type:complete
MTQDPVPIQRTARTGIGKDFVNLGGKSTGLYGQDGSLKNMPSATSIARDVTLILLSLSESGILAGIGCGQKLKQDEP